MSMFRRSHTKTRPSDSDPEAEAKLPQESSLTKQYCPRPNKLQPRRSAKVQLILHQRTRQRRRIPNFAGWVLGRGWERGRGGIMFSLQLRESPLLIALSATHFHKQTQSLSDTNRWLHRWCKRLIFTKQGSAHLGEENRKQNVFLI